MAKRVLRKKQGEGIPNEFENLEEDVFLNDTEKPSTSGQVRTRDSDSAIWREKAPDGSSIASSNILAINDDSRDIDDDTDLINFEDEQATLERKQLGGIDEIAIEQDPDIEKQVLRENKKNKGKKRVKREIVRRSSITKRKGKAKRKAIAGVDRSDSTKELIGGSSEASSNTSSAALNNQPTQPDKQATETSDNDSDNHSVGFSENEQVLYTESESNRKRESGRPSSSQVETDQPLIDLNSEFVKPPTPAKSEQKSQTGKQQKRKSNSSNKSKETTSSKAKKRVENVEVLKQNEPKGLLWQPAPRELITGQEASLDDNRRYIPRSYAFNDHIRVFKPPKAKPSQQNSDKTPKLNTIVVARPQSFTQIAAEIPPENSSQYTTTGKLFISEKPDKFPLINKMAVNHTTSHKGHVKASQNMTSLHSLYAENGAVSRYTLKGLSTLPQELKVVAVPPELQRSTLRKARNAVEMAISNFQIIFDNSATHYTPGMPITGKVVMDVWSSVEIRYVEFVLQGKATIRIFGGGGKFLEKPQSEMYLQKRIILLSPAKGQSHLTLTPGKYVSEFAYKLPENLPASVDQTDVSDNCVFAVTYSARANVCDYLHARHIPQSERYAQVVKTCRKEFAVLPQYDYRCLPGAMDPITHAEQFNVLCSPLNKGHTSVLVKLDHQLFTIGDVMNLDLEVCTPDVSRIKNITANMVQTVIFRPPVARQFKRTVIKAIDLKNNKNSQRKRSTGHAQGQNGKSVYRCSFGIPIPNNLIPSLLLYARIIQVSYCMDVKVSFKNLGGSLHMRIPVVLASATEPEAACKSPSVPVFNKPVMQFPYFSRGPLRDSLKSAASLKSAGSKESLKMNDTVQAHSLGQRHERVRAKYVHCFSFDV